MSALAIIDGIELPQVGLGSGWALLTVVVILILRGQLVPRRTHEDAIHDRDEWRAESRIKDAQIAEKDGQLRELSSVGEAVRAVMRAIQRGPKDEVS